MAPTRPAHKYASEIFALGNCPPANCSPASCTAYHFVFDPVSDPRCFQAPGKRDPDKNAQCCAGWALSMFESEPKARAFFGKLLKRFRMARSRIGTHVAEGTLTPTHGIVDAVEKNGHFNLHEHAGVNLAPVFKIVGGPL